MKHVGSWFPHQGLNLCPLHWEPGVLTIGLSGKSLKSILNVSVLKRKVSFTLGSHRTGRQSERLDYDKANDFTLISSPGHMRALPSNVVASPPTCWSCPLPQFSFHLLTLQNHNKVTPNWNWAMFSFLFQFILFFFLSLSLFRFLVMPCSMWDHSSLPRDQTRYPLLW